MSLDPRTLTDEQVGTRLRDGAVDPRDGDFLGPTNAGVEGELGNPHGPHVVNPEIHAMQDNRPVRAGAVRSATQSCRMRRTGGTHRPTRRSLSPTPAVPDPGEGDV